MPLRPFTPAQSQAARAARIEKRAAMIAATQHYKKDWMDAGWWEELAQKQAIRLPPWHVPPTPAKLQSWARKLRKTPFAEHYGCSPARLISLNPRTPLRAFVGQMLEP